MSLLVDTQVKYIHHLMPGAPQLGYGAGNLNALLKAFLCDGWGDQVPSSVLVADGIATATFPQPHAASEEAVILVRGDVTHDLVGEHKVIAVDGNQVSWRVQDLVDGDYTEDITLIGMAPAGFVKRFEELNVLVLRSGRPAAHGMNLRVYDNGGGMARVRGYEVMTSAQVGTYPFPSEVQAPGGGYWDKATTNSATPTPYAMASDGYSIIFCPAAHAVSGDSNLACSELYFFGDALEETPAGDPFATLLSCSPEESAYSPTTRYEGLVGSHFAPRPRSAGVGSVELLVANYVTRMFGPFPDRVSGRAHGSKRFIQDAGDPYVRAEQPGVLDCLQTGVLQHKKPYDLMRVEGRNYLVIPSGPYDMSITDEQCPVSLIDVTGPWHAPDGLREVPGLVSLDPVAHFEAALDEETP